MDFCLVKEGRTVEGTATQYDYRSIRRLAREFDCRQLAENLLFGLHHVVTQGQTEDKQLSMYFDGESLLVIVGSRMYVEFRMKVA